MQARVIMTAADLQRLFAQAVSGVKPEDVKVQFLEVGGKTETPELIAITCPVQIVLTVER